MTVKFRFKSGTTVKLLQCPEKPSWKQLVSTIVGLFNLPTEQIGVSFVDPQDQGIITIRNEEELKDFYEVTLPSGTIKFNVHADSKAPDGECTFYLLSNSR
jgi:hypothetical protein